MSTHVRAPARNARMSWTRGCDRRPESVEVEVREGDLEGTWCFESTVVGSKAWLSVSASWYPLYSSSRTFGSSYPSMVVMVGREAS